MKKYILMLAVAAATTLVACGNKEAEATEEVPTDSVEVIAEEVVEVVDSIAPDTTAIDTTVVVAE